MSFFYTLRKKRNAILIIIGKSERRNDKHRQLMKEKGLYIKCLPLTISADRSTTKVYFQSMVRILVQKYKHFLNGFRGLYGNLSESLALKYVS